MTNSEFIDRLKAVPSNPKTSEEAISSDKSVRYVVMDENTLGLVRDDRPDALEVLAGSVYLGGHNPLRGPWPIGISGDIRPATLADFEAFGVSPQGHLSNAPKPRTALRPG